MTKRATSRPVAEPRWPSSKATHCRVFASSMSGDLHESPPLHCWKLEDEPRPRSRSSTREWTRQALADDTGVDVLVAPPAISIPAGRRAPQTHRYSCRRVDLHPADSGAYTSHSSGGMLKEAGCEYVPVGHSERRSLFGDDDVAVNAKVHAAFKNGLLPILCIGETLPQREAGEAVDVVTQQPGARPGGLSTGPGRINNHRLRARVGHRYRSHGQPGTGAGDARSHPWVARRSLSSFRAEADSNSIRRKRQAWKRCGTPQPARYRRRLGRRSLIGSGQLCCNRPRWNLKGKPCNSSSLFCTLFWRSS